jgi:hypothetical protein
MATRAAGRFPPSLRAALGEAGGVPAAAAAALAEYAVEALLAGQAPSASKAGKLGVANGAADAEVCGRAALAFGAAALELAKQRVAGEGEAAAALSLAAAGPEAAAAVAAAYAAREVALKALAGALEDGLSAYVDLDWRLDVELGTRSLGHTVQPSFALRLGLSDGAHALQADYANMKHLEDELARAVQEAKSPHALRFLKYIR